MYMIYEKTNYVYYSVKLSKVFIPYLKFTLRK